METPVEIQYLAMVGYESDSALIVEYGFGCGAQQSADPKFVFS